MRLLIATYVYGEQFLDLFDRYCLRSLMQAGNIPYLLKQGYEIIYIIYTKPRDVQRLTAIIDKYKTEKIEYRITTNRFVGNETEVSKANSIFLLESVGFAVTNKAPFFLASPDIFVGDFSLSNLLTYNTNKDICLAALHLRVDSVLFQRWYNEEAILPVSNARLVTTSMGILSQSWRDSFIDKGRNCSFTANSAVQKIQDNLYNVTFRIPNVFLARLNQSDVDYFNQHPNLGNWDHSWPEHLVKGRRYKFIGSSDMFFACEATYVDNNKSDCRDNDLWNDECINTKLHSETNRNFLAIIRGE